MNPNPELKPPQEKPYTIAIFTDDDQEEIKKLGREVSPDAGQPYADDWNHIRETYIDTGGIFYVAKVDGKIVGCGGVKKIDDDKAEFVRFRIFKEYRERGIGRALSELSLNFIKQNGFKKVSLDTYNPIVKKLCEENGFVITKIVKNGKETFYCEKDLTS